MKSWYPLTGSLMMVVITTILSMKEDSLAEGFVVVVTTAPTSGVISPRSSSSLSMMDLSSSTYTGIDMINDFFQTQPFVAAFMTCSLKASTADMLAQTSTSTSSSEDEDAKVRSATIEINSHHQHCLGSLIDNPLRMWLENEKRGTAPTKSLREDSSLSSSFSSSSSVNWSRTLAFYLYGGLYQGMFLQFLYTIAYPTIYGNHPHQLLLQVHTDIVLFGPFVTLPLAYVLRALIDGTSSSQPTTLEHPVVPQDNNDILIMEHTWCALEKYKNHIVSQNLLWKYWAIWGPAQTFNFTMVPPHLRVVFVACVSFFWVYLLSMISSQETMATTTKEATKDAVTIPMSSSQQTPYSTWRIQHYWQDVQDTISKGWKNGIRSTNRLSKPV
jgi:hypothetical protein